MSSGQDERFGSIVLCGGKSRRMGRPKATLPFGPELLLQRVVRILRQVTSPCVVVAAANQQLPELPPEILITTDERPERGPLEALYAGLRVLEGKAAAAYVTACDVPLLLPEFVTRMTKLLGDHDIVVPVEDEFHHPLAAVYRVTVLPQIKQLLAQQRLRPVFLFDQVDTARVPMDQLQDVDTQLQSLVNLNHPADYEAALASAGYGDRGPS